MNVLAYISTKGRYDTTLPLAMLSIATQTRPPDKFVLFDDNPYPQDLRLNPLYVHIFKLMERNGISWEVVYGAKRGQHYNHEKAQGMATELVWRVDDDQSAETRVLELLLKHMDDPKIGAVGGLVAEPDSGKLPDNAHNKIANVWLPNLQWYIWHGTPHIVEHLYSSFLYRKGIAHYELGLSSAAHREETLFTHEIFRKGYKLIVEPKAVTWHLRNPNGGIRNNGEGDFAHDEKIFEQKRAEWGITTKPVKHIVLDSGVGDHIVLKSILPSLKEKYQELIIYACYPEVFPGENLKSIAEAQRELGNLDRFNIYKWMADRNWNQSLQEAFIALYL